MLKDVQHLLSPDPYYAGTAGFVGCSIEKLHQDMSRLELPSSVPEGIRRCHDAVRHTYLYSYFSYDLLTVAASQTLPCLELAPVELEDAGRPGYWAKPDVLETAHTPASEIVHILSPFDPLIIQRKRTDLFFGYNHRFEAYVPKEKRLFGYFALPVIVGDEIVAAIDLKTDRALWTLLVQKWTWVGGSGSRGGLKGRIEEELHRFERFQLAG